MTLFDEIEITLLKKFGTKRERMNTQQFWIKAIAVLLEGLNCCY